MTKKILIVIGDKSELESEGYKTYKGLQQLGRDEYSCVRYRNIEIVMTSEQVHITADGVDINEYDLVYIRDFQGYEPERNTIADYCKRRGIVFVNKDTAISQKISKLAQYMVFAFDGVPFPQSVYAHSSRLREVAERNISYPMIVKSILARSGNDNYLINSRSQFDELLTKKPDVKFIAQEAIPNDGDFRVIVLGEKVSCVYRRVAKAGDHRNNVSQGGDKQYLALSEISEESKQVAVAAARSVGRDICGVDIMVDKRSNQPVVLEANFNFGIRAIPGVLSEELEGLSEYLHDRAKGN